MRQKLEERRKESSDGVERNRLKLALQTLDRAFIGTIHAFCAHLLHQRPVEACIDPDFSELDEGAARTLFGSVFRVWMTRNLASPSPTLKRALARLAWKQDGTPDGPLERLEEAAWNLAQWRDHENSWELRDFERDEKMLGLFQQACTLARNLENPSKADDRLRQTLDPVYEMVQRRQMAKAVDAADADDVETELLALPSRFVTSRTTRATAISTALLLLVSRS